MATSSIWADNRNRSIAPAKIDRESPKLLPNPIAQKPIISQDLEDYEIFRIELSVLSQSCISEFELSTINFQLPYALGKTDDDRRVRNRQKGFGTAVDPIYVC